MVNQTLLCICWHVQCIWQCAKSLLFGSDKCPQKQGNPAGLPRQAVPDSVYPGLVEVTANLQQALLCTRAVALQGAGLPGSASSLSSWLLKVRPRNSLPSTWDMPRGSSLHELPITASWPWPQNWLILIWQYPLFHASLLEVTVEREKQMGHKSKTSLFPKCKSVHKSLWSICMSLLHEKMELTIYRTWEIYLPLCPPGTDYHKEQRGFRSLVLSHQALPSFPAPFSLVASLCLR